MTRRVSARRNAGLRELADRVGILAEYENNRGRRVSLSSTTRDALLNAMGIDAPTDDAALAWMDELDFHERGDATPFEVAGACVSPEMKLGDDKVMGVIANLYAARREKDWGVGDFTTLMLLVEWAASRGAEFVGVNPLHALFNRSGNVSPYSPVSRVFRNHIYIDVQEVPEWMPYRSNKAESADAYLARAAGLREERLVDYDRVAALKERVLYELYRLVWDAESPTAEQRHREFAQFAGEREPELTRYATWMAIAEESGTPDWRLWAAAMHDPQSPAVETFAVARARRIDFHRWLQFETHRQLTSVANRAKVLGMRIGLYQDLAVGTHPGGADTWGEQELFLHGAAIGAPPDPYSATGQNWNLAPMDPRVLRRDGYRHWIRVLRSALECAGALRIDHVMGLFRLYWIPEGADGRSGGYVRYPSSELLGILAKESLRHDALIIGEDLGTVPRDVPRALKARNILSSKVLYFEREPRKYPRLSLATVGTHDMAPMAGWPEFRKKPLTSERTSAMHDEICASQAVLAGVALDDLLGETEAINVPGLSQDEYPCWRRKSRMTIEAMAWDAEVDRRLGCESRRAAGRVRQRRPLRDS